MKRLSGPIDVQLELTENCNYRCRHCYNYWRYGEKNDSREMDIAQVARVIGILRDSGVSVITLTGGEPLLRSDILFAALKEAKRAGMEAGLNTNATLISPDIAARLKDEGLDHALCSVLGKEQTHNHITCTKDGFSHTIRGVENLVKAGIPVAANMVMSTLNQDEVFDVGGLVSGLGATAFCGTPMMPSHESNRQYLLSGSECKQALRALLSVEKAFGIRVDTLEPVARCLFDESEDDEFMAFFASRICSAAITSCAVSPAGMVRPCIQADKVFGNLLQEDFSAVWANMSPWTEADMLPAECASCEATAICEGGCRMSAKILHGCYDGQSIYMSAPISDAARATKLPVRNKPEAEITEHERVVVNPLARCRQESFGGIVYVGNHVEFLTPVGFSIARVMLSRGVFSPAEIAESVAMPNGDIVAVVQRLLGNKVLNKR